MNDKRYLFRGFHPDEKGNTTIVVNGEKIKGMWVYGDLITRGNAGYCIHPKANLFQVGRADLSTILITHPVITETIGQFVTTYKNGKDVFEGDYVKSYTDLEIQGIVEWQKQECRFIVELFPNGYDWLCMDDDEWEVWGNKWE